MKSSASRRSCAALLAALALAACAGAPKGPPLAPRKLQAIEANNRGAASFSRGDYAGAIEQYRHALALERSIENEDGIAANLINLSIAYQRQGDPAAARAALQEILEDRLIKFPAPRVAEAALRNAVLLLDARDIEGATQWVTRAQASCARDCLLAGKLLNVQAQLAVLRQDYAAARAAAARALAANRSQDDREEVANSLRLIAASALAAREPGDVEALLREALAIDKDLALPSRIYRDLLLLGQAATARRAGDDAATYFGRALAVARSLGDPEAIAEANAFLKVLQTGPAKNP